MVQVPLVASNRIGTEKGDKSSITFYGGSFIAGSTGEIIKQVRRTSQPILFCWVVTGLCWILKDPLLPCESRS